MTALPHQTPLPISIPIWGVLDNDHIHMENHLNFIFHVADGIIIGAACYPG